ncbi:MAG: DUF2017 domain-containing protein [Candidatus Nanopelagicales bacterium]
MALGFQRVGDRVSTQLEPVEQMLITALIDELSEILRRPDEPDRAEIDPLARELGLEGLTGHAPDPPDNPIAARLLPDGYRDDLEAALEFRRYTDDSLRATKLADAEVMRAGLESAADDPEGRIEIELAEADHWVRAINDLRLALGVELGIADDPSGSADRWLGNERMEGRAMLYDFLTWWQDGLVLSLMGE